MTIIVQMVGTTLGSYLTEKSYAYSPDETKLLSASTVDKSLVKSTATGYSYNRSEESKVDDPVQKLSAATKEDSTGKTPYQVNLPLDSSEGVEFGDSIGLRSFKLIPQFATNPGRGEDGRVVYPTSSSEKHVYTFKKNGVKGDISIVKKPKSDTKTFKYKLALGDGLDAKMLPDGGVGIYSADSSLYDNIQVGDQKSQELIDKARKKGERNVLTFEIPKPYIVNLNDQKNYEDVSYKLDGSTLILEAKNLKNQQYPLSIDPTIIVTTTTDFQTASGNTNNTDFGTSGQINRSVIGSGGVGAGWTDGYVYTGSYSPGGALATGGSINIVNESGTDYVYHTFTSDGTFTPSTSLNATYLVVGGGGGGTDGGGGGGGGVVYSTSTISTAQSVVIGAGGSVSSSGANSTLGAITAYGGGAGGGGTGTSGGSGGGGGPNGCTPDFWPAYPPTASCGFSGGSGSQGNSGGYGQNFQYRDWFFNTGYTTYDAGGGGGAGTVGGTNGGNGSTYFGATYGGGGAGWSRTCQFASGEYCDSGSGGYAFGGAGGTGGGGSSSPSGSGGYCSINGFSGTANTGGGGGGGCSGSYGAGGSGIVIIKYAAGLPSYPTPPFTERAYATSVAYNGYLYILGGCTVFAAGVCTTYSNTVNYASLGSNGAPAASMLTTTSFTTGRNGLRAAAYNGYMYITGGGNAGGYFNDTQYALICTGTNSGVGGCGATPGTLGTWATAAASPFTTTRSSHHMSIYNGFMYISGGSNGTPLSDVQYAPINADGTLGSWTAATGLPATRYGHEMVVNNGFIYVLGGYSAGYLSSTIYAPINSNGTLGAWLTTTAMTSNHYWFGSAVSNGYVYAVGGNDGSVFSTKVEYAPFNADGTIGAWTAGASIATGREGGSAVAYNGYLYAISGRTGTNTIIADVQYAPIGAGRAGAFTQQASAFTTARYGHTSVAYNGFVYIIGGKSSSSSLNDIQYCQLNANGSVGSCTVQAAAFTTARYIHSSIVHNGYLYIIGGYSGASALNDIQYCPLNANGSVGTCTVQASAFTSARYYHSSAVFNGYLYIVGGFAGGYLNDVQYCPITAAGSVGSCTVQSAAFTTPRERLAAVASNGYLYIVGGFSGASYLSDIQYCQINTNGSINACTVQASAFTTGRAHHTASIYNGYLFIVGG